MIIHNTLTTRPAAITKVSASTEMNGDGSTYDVVTVTYFDAKKKKGAEETRSFTFAELDQLIQAKEAFEARRDAAAEEALQVEELEAEVSAAE